MNNKEPVKLTTTNALQSEFDEADVKISQKNCNLQQNFVPPDGGCRVSFLTNFLRISKESSKIVTKVLCIYKIF